MLIEIRNLQKSVAQKNVLDIPDFGVEAGTISAMIGTTGSGKELLLELLLGKTRPTMGTIRLGGIDPFAEGEAFSHKVGVQFAEENLYIRQTALSNLEFFCKLHRLPSSRAGEVLQEVGLADNARTRVEELSPSLNRRLTFARAILHKPQILLLIEPFHKCDQNTVEILSRLILKEAERGTAGLIIAENRAHLSKICTNLYQLENGQVSEAIQPEDGQIQTMPFMIPAKLEGKVALVNPTDILYAIAQDNKAYLQTANDLFPTQFTLSELETRLSRSGFFRAHRSYLVNLQHVKEVIPYTRDSYSLRLRDEANTEIPLSKSAARELRELLGY